MIYKNARIGEPVTKNCIGIAQEHADEAWLDVAIRFAKPFGLEQEVIETYQEAIAKGESEEVAALIACMEWDVATASCEPAHPKEN